MTAHLLTRAPYRDRPALSLLGQIALPLARAHEGCGPARRSFAMLVAAQTSGPVFWITPAWASDRLNPDGMTRFAGPERFTFLTPKRPEDVLWCMEDILRSGTVPLVVADIPAPPALTPVRRLHLAAETGAAQGIHRPLGLLLTPGDGGAQGVETRWYMAPAHSGATTECWLLERRRARTAPQKAWYLQPTDRGLQLTAKTPMPVA